MIPLIIEKKQRETFTNVKKRERTRPHSCYMAVPLSYIHHCRQLLLEHERTWLEFQKQHLSANNDGAAAISPFINYKGKPYDCRTNSCVGNCLWDASEPHQKCKCQALYMPGKGHLHAPCLADEKGPHLTYDQCKSLGYLKEEDGDKDSTFTLGNNLAPLWPAITCDHCRESFEALQKNFTPYNYHQVENCISRLSMIPDVQQQSKHSSKWYGIGLVVLIFLTGFISYKLLSGTLCQKKGNNSTTCSRTCPIQK